MYVIPALFLLLRSDEPDEPQGPFGYLWFVDVLWHGIPLKILSADPHDPLKHLYDVDDGEYFGSYWSLTLRVPVENTVITLMDWSVLWCFIRGPWIYSYSAQVQRTLTTGGEGWRVMCDTISMLRNLTGIQSLPASNLINGRGRQPSLPGTENDVALSVVNVEPDKRYRFRVINAACITAFNFSIDGHDMTVIEIDGVETIPHKVGVVSLYASMASNG